MNTRLQQLKRTLAFAFLISMGCGDDHLRGSVAPSPDEKTYLAIMNSNNCDTLKVDGKEWPHPIGQPGEIGPGPHTIECNGEIGFTVPAGVVFKFDYWGP